MKKRVTVPLSLFYSRLMACLNVVPFLAFFSFVSSHSHLVKYLVTNDLASKIRVVDKVMPALAYLTREFEEVFNAPVVEFKQANLTNPCLYCTVCIHFLLVVFWMCERD